MSRCDRDGVARARELVACLHPDTSSFGIFTAVDPGCVPPGPRRLLDHRSHMTVAMERHHGGPVQLRVIDRRGGPPAPYLREILLASTDGRVVQHGIVRIDMARLAPETTAAILAERLPLGRILLAAGLMCDVQDVRLLEVRPGPHLRELFGPGGEAATFGRVAQIGLAGSPAIELLEIVAPGTAG